MKKFIDLYISGGIRTAAIPPDTAKDQKGSDFITNIMDIAINKKAGLAFITSYNAIQIIDIKDPKNPRLLNTILSVPDTTGTSIPIGPTPSIVEQGGWVYMANQIKGMRILDLDPAVINILNQNNKKYTFGIDELQFSDGTKQEKTYHIEADISTYGTQYCTQFQNGKIKVIDKTGKTIINPITNKNAEYTIKKFQLINNKCIASIIDPKTGAETDKFIITNADISPTNTVTIYGGIGNSFKIQVTAPDGTYKEESIKIEPVGVIIIGIDGLRQDVLYPDNMDKIQDGGKYRVNINELQGLKQILAGFDQPADKQRYTMLPEVTAIFPSITLASWASIFTGKLPKETGILGNEFFDRPSGEMVSLDDGAFPMMDITDRFPLTNTSDKSGVGAPISS